MKTQEWIRFSSMLPLLAMSFGCALSAGPYDESAERVVEQDIGSAEQPLQVLGKDADEAHQLDLVTQAVAQTSLPSNVTVAQAASLVVVTQALRDQDEKRALSMWNEMLQIQTAVDVNALVMYVLRNAYLETAKDLRYYADKVRFSNQAKKEVRKYLSGLRSIRNRLEPLASVRVNAVVFLDYHEDGEPLAESGTKLMNRAQLDDAVKYWQEVFDRLRNAEKQEKVDLEEELRRQRPLVRKMLNTSELLHKVAKVSD